MVLCMHKLDRLRSASLPSYIYDGSQHRLAVIIPPCPGVAEPQSGEQVERHRFWSAIGGANADQDVEWVNFGIFYGDIEVAVFRENARVDQLVFGLLTTTIAI